jgi:hypothetical protein
MLKRLTLLVCFAAVCLPSHAGLSSGGAIQIGGAVSADQAATPSATQTQPAKPAGFRLEDGTPIKLRLTRTISSADA